MKYCIKDYSHIRKEVEAMSIDELLLAVICPDIIPGNPAPKNTTSVFLHPATTEKAYETAKAINEERQNRALIVADMEFGAGEAIEGAVEFPSMRAASETEKKELAYEMGVIAAKEAMLAGYHWTFGPCVDIVGNKENPIITLRTSGEDANTVIDYSGAYMEGLQDTGLIATLKHFPGDGFCQDDQHLTVTENPLSKEEWDESFGKVYSTLIERGAMSIMPGHISLPAYDEIDKNTGLYPPATVSKNILTGLLKEKLGFKGIIVSDAIIMSGFCGYMNLYRACATFLEAGGDCILFMHGHEEYLREMKKYINEGILSLETLKNRAYRMRCFAQEYFEKYFKEEIKDFNREKAECIAKEMSQRCVKIIRDRRHILPYEINETTRIAHIVLHSHWNSNFRMVEELTAKLQTIAGKVDEYRDPGCGKSVEIAKSGEYDLIVCSVVENSEYGLNTAKLSGPMARNMMAGWMRYQTPVIFIGYYNPYFGDTYKAVVDTMINTYGYTKYTIEAVIERLTGK